ncbi:MAG TPA: MoxR family ATPase [Acidimicrobiales bacterium]
MDRPGSPADVQALLGGQSYLADRGLSTAIFLALTLERPLLLEGEAGVGKTEVAKAMAAAFAVELVRLQCYEGIDASQALYEWDYARQLLSIRAAPDGQADRVDDLFSARFLVERPLLKALRAGEAAVLLIDEVDRADDEFEAFLLEVLSDFQVTVPELGTIRAEKPPLVIVTSNRTRELHDALKRRCLYHWIDYPSLEQEVRIVLARAPGVPAELAGDVAVAVSRLRGLDLAKRPGVAETIDWAEALAVLGAAGLDVESARDTLGAVVKDHDDVELVLDRLPQLVGDG